MRCIEAKVTGALEILCGCRAIQFVGAQTCYTMVFNVHARDVAMIGRNAKVIIEPNLQGAGLQIFCVIDSSRAAVTQMPLADGRGAVPVLFQQGSQVYSSRFDVQGRQRAKHLVF